jgi:hypothetical protein
VTRWIYADETKPIPRPVFAEFTCDGDHGLFDPSKLTVELFVAGRDSWTQATAHGWSVTPELCLCPECKGKPS